MPPTAGPKRRPKPGSLFSTPGQGLYLPTITRPSRMTGATGFGPNYGMQSPFGAATGYSPNYRGTQQLGSPNLPYEVPAFSQQAAPTPARVGQTTASVGPKWTQANLGGGGTGRQQQSGYRPPPGIDPKWYAQFKEQHGGQAPEQAYGTHREGLAEALADREWSQGFAQTNGRPPSQYDWENWYYQSRYGGRPGPPRGTTEYKAMRAALRYKAERKRRKMRRAARMVDGVDPEYDGPGSAMDPGKRPPLYVPPQTVWR